MRGRLAGLLGTAIIVGACGSSTDSPSLAVATGTPGASPTAVATASRPSATTPAPTGSPHATPLPRLSGRWESAGQLALGRLAPRAVLLGDGHVLVIGNELPYPNCVMADSATSEVWDPESNAWTAGPTLNKPRAEFAAAATDGRALITGGVNAGVVADSEQSGHQSYSSTWIFDPARPKAGWARAGLLDHARTSPAAVTLADGRVLLLGGYYQSGQPDGWSPVGRLVAYRPEGPAEERARSPLADIDPPGVVPTLATAEAFDPEAGAWSKTGPMRYARVAPPAVRLADGRVLVVGSATGRSGWDYTVAQPDHRAYTTAELYDPSSGRFTQTGDLPEVDWSSLERLGPYPIESVEVSDAGTLVALPDGGALLVGHATSWTIGAFDLFGTTVRTLRFDPGSEQWTVVDQDIHANAQDEDGSPKPGERFVEGHTRTGSVAIPLVDGHILLAGGFDNATGVMTTAADLYDPVADRWAELPSMPMARAGGAVVALDDGSVMLVGGVDPTVDPASASRSTTGCQVGSTGLTTAIRFVPEPSSAP